MLLIRRWAKYLRKLMPKTFILVPGYGAQGGKGADLVHFFNEDGLGAIVNSSRGIIAAYKQEAYAKFGELKLCRCIQSGSRSNDRRYQTAHYRTANMRLGGDQMSTKTKENADRLSARKSIGTDIYSMWLQTDQNGTACSTGTVCFFVYSRMAANCFQDRSVSVRLIKKTGRLRLVYRVTGKSTGTEEFSQTACRVTQFEHLGPLGNGFPLEEAEGKKVFLIGGGIGIPPMLETCKTAELQRKQLFLDTEMSCFLNEEFAKIWRCLCCNRRRKLQEQREMFWMQSVRMALEADVILCLRTDSDAPCHQGICS